MPEKPNIGFIGLGLMGQAFTKRLTSCGYTVTGFDIDPGKVERATGHGVVAAASSAEVADKSDIVLVCVISTDAVHDAVKREKSEPESDTVSPASVAAA